MKLLALLSLTLFSLSLEAGIYVQQNGRITAITTGNSGDPTKQAFFIKVSKNQGSCVAGNWISINKSDFGTNADGYKMAYSTAISALTTGSNNVSVYNAASDACSKATWIAIEN